MASFERSSSASFVPAAIACDQSGQSSTSNDCSAKMDSVCALWPSAGSVTEHSSSLPSPVSDSSASISFDVGSSHSPSLSPQHEFVAKPKGNTDSDSGSGSVSGSGRLSHQRDYDHWRRQLLKRRFAELRQTLQEAKCMTWSNGRELLGDLSTIRSKYAIKSKNDVDNCSNIDLMYAAGRAIGRLTKMKEELERQLEEEEIKERGREVSTHRKERCDPHEPTGEEARTKRVRRDSSESADVCGMGDIQSLLHAISVVSGRFTDELRALQAVKEQSPRLLADDWMELMQAGVLGMNSQLVTYAGWMNDGSMDYRSPHMIQVHAMCALLSNGLYQMPKRSKKTFTNISRPTLLQLFYDYHPSNRSAAYSASSSSSASSLASTSTMAASFASAFDSHPLSGYALSADNFRLFLSLLHALVELGECGYNQFANDLRHLASKSFREQWAGMTLFPFPAGDAGKNIVDVAFHPSTKLSYRDLCSMFELYSGQRDIISFHIQKPSHKEERRRDNGFDDRPRCRDPNDHLHSNMDRFLKTLSHPVEWVDVELQVCLIRHPQTGIPLAQMSIPNKVRPTDRRLREKYDVFLQAIEHGID